MNGFSTQPTPANSDVAMPRPEAGTKPLATRRRVAAASKQIEPIAATVKVTLDHWRDGYTSRHLSGARFHATRISAEEAVALKLLSTSLNEQGAKLDDGCNVQTNQHALRWLLQRLAEQVPAELMQELIAA